MYVRSWTADELQTLQEGLRSSDALVLRRCQILLASARGQTARMIGDTLGCDDQTVRNVIHAFNPTGLRALPRRSAAPQRTPHAAFSATPREQWRALLPQRPRTIGHPTRLWTLPFAAAVAYAAGRSRASGGAGSGPSTGSPVPSPRTSEKKRRDRLMALAVPHPTWGLGLGAAVW